MMNTMQPSNTTKAESLPPNAVIFGHSSPMAAVRERLHKVADTNLPILLEGESGTGKEVIARYLHRNSPWSAEPFVKVNCPVLSDNLAKSDQSGYAKDLFTGIFGSEPGPLCRARGFLFLDQISELAVELQPRLFQLLQNGQFSPITMQKNPESNFRIVCATSRQLQQEVAAGRLRKELFYCISVVSLRLSALRERICDIPALVDYFLERHGRAYKRKVRQLSTSAMNRLAIHNWPGNIRELENLIKRYVVLGDEDLIMADLMSPMVANFKPDLPPDGSIALKKITRAAIRDLEGRIILNTLQQYRWNRKQAARALNISYRSLLYKLKEAGLELRRSSNAEQN